MIADFGVKSNLGSFWTHITQQAKPAALERGEFFPILEPFGGFRYAAHSPQPVKSLSSISCEPQRTSPRDKTSSPPTAPAVGVGVTVRVTVRWGVGLTVTEQFPQCATMLGCMVTARRKGFVSCSWLTREQNKELRSP